MKAPLSCLLLALFATAMPTSQAARVSEPSTTFYGRIVHRVGTRAFPITQGRLEWTLGSPLPGGEHRLTAAVSSVGDGSFQYILRIPHQLLAYDLTVAPAAVPLTAGPTRFRHLRVTVDGHAATLVAPSVDGFTADQSTRAASHRIDLELSDFSPDSDGDGFPDWWEDRTGTDKWDPTDGPPPPPPPPPTTDPGTVTESTLTRFAQWRSLYFTGDTQDLDAFAKVDADADRVVNLLEYAFGLDPRRADESTPWLATMSLRDGRPTLTYGVRRQATDLDYVVEISEDLLEWRSAGEDEIESSTAAADATFDRRTVHPKGDVLSQSYLRIRVNLKK